ncbi:VOC family protein [Sphingobium vermicomposti]|uniref:Putative enzyme related to lactoylglutathione lyase n=1 Tax=Sphingobium vermicomposti TaxID=529005 RepID=A0A846M8N1_9SPHN|nr:VOC family protein [Sphingobium vermicomposti]NIJ18222.1 putative enzyme related to lactoylglutathione lyase [Sphingobium vermicomposti]
MTNLPTFTKLICRDEEAMAQYYGTVYGYGLVQRVEGDINGEAFREVIMAPGGDWTKGTLVMFNYVNRDAPRDQQVILGFTVPDLDALVEKIIANGGKLCGPIHEEADHGVRVVFSTDPEGALCENVQMLAVPQAG